ncbi:hypothetical protein [Streptomyces sp. NBC_00094]|uniref:hypothetical protein n=1 Tax=Streptomyces sp. NBC_00094 TaxID=2903620 RepID=UPI002251D1D2|nr:hypothetical protein [Streptomyces sp. NBC_00094]MCX5391530.1 hypothetical protein [Streptomyces sp. NBC_00094]
MADYLDNPAGRLRDLLLALHAATSGEQQQKQTLAWDAIVDLVDPGASWARQMSIVGLVVDLPVRVREEVRLLSVDDDHKETLQQHLDEIENGMAQVASRQSLHAMFTAFAPGADVPRSGAITGLGYCSYELHRAVPEVVISDDDLARIAGLINELMEGIAEAQLPAPVKRAMLAHLTTLLQAVHDVRFAGTEPLGDALFALLGSAHGMGAEENLKQGLWSKLMTVARDLGGLLSSGQSAAQLGQGIAGMLGGGG